MNIVAQLQWLPHYNLKDFVRDVTAALTVRPPLPLPARARGGARELIRDAACAQLTSMLVPQSMSYATSLVHTDPVHGLFGASIPAMLYSVLGTCRQLSVGPEAALSLLTGEFISKVIETEEHAHGALSVAQKARLAVTITTCITFESGLVTFLCVSLSLWPWGRPRFSRDLCVPRLRRVEYALTLLPRSLGFFRLGFLDAVLSRVRPSPLPRTRPSRASLD